jgi:hypothetical protein
LSFIIFERSIEADHVPSRNSSELACPDAEAE